MHPTTNTILEQVKRSVTQGTLALKLAPLATLILAPL